MTKRKYDIVGYYPLAPTVLAVAVRGTVGDWAAYVKGVPGENHENEVDEVARSGTKLRKEIAELIFPRIKKELIWRH